MLMYCKRCGRTIMDSKKCDICNSATYDVPEKYLLLYNGKIYKNNLNENKKNQFIEECIKSSPEFDEELFNNRDKIRAQKSAEYEQKIAIGEAILNGAAPKMALKYGGKNMPKCPTCGSLSVKKIGGAERAVSVGMFGLFSKKINKTFKCGNCGYTW